MGVLLIALFVSCAAAHAQDPYADLPGTPSASATPTTTAAIARLEQLRTRLAGRLTGYTFTDPADRRISYHQVRREVPWAATDADAKAFNEGMLAMVSGLHGQPEALRTRAIELVRWGRGKVLYQVRGIVGTATREVKLLDFDFAPELLPVPPRPQASPRQ